MKIIKIARCEDCPHSTTFYYAPSAYLKCEEETIIKERPYQAQRGIVVGAGIPEWCPLEEWDTNDGR